MAMKARRRREVSQPARKDEAVLREVEYREYLAERLRYLRLAGAKVGK